MPSIEEQMIGYLSGREKVPMPKPSDFQKPQQPFYLNKVDSAAGVPPPGVTNSANISLPEPPAANTAAATVPDTAAQSAPARSGRPRVSSLPEGNPDYGVASKIMNAPAAGSVDESARNRALITLIGQERTATGADAARINTARDRILDRPVTQYSTSADAFGRSPYADNKLRTERAQLAEALRSVPGFYDANQGTVTENDIKFIENPEAYLKRDPKTGAISVDKGAALELKRNILTQKDTEERKRLEDERSRAISDPNLQLQYSRYGGIVPGSLAEVSRARERNAAALSAPLPESKYARELGNIEKQQAELRAQGAKMEEKQWDAAEFTRRYGLTSEHETAIERLKQEVPWMVAMMDDRQKTATNDIEKQRITAEDRRTLLGITAARENLTRTLENNLQVAGIGRQNVLDEVAARKVVAEADRAATIRASEIAAKAKEYRAPEQREQDIQSAVWTGMRALYPGVTMENFAEFAKKAPEIQTSKDKLEQRVREQVIINSIPSSYVIEEGGVRKIMAYNPKSKKTVELTPEMQAAALADVRQ